MADPLRHRSQSRVLRAGLHDRRRNPQTPRAGPGARAPVSLRLKAARARLDVSERGRVYTGPTVTLQVDRTTLRQHMPARDHCLAPSRAGVPPSTHAGRYGRMFPDLAPLECAEDLLFAIGRSGGMLDPRTGVRGAGDTAHGAAGWP